jgi:hypothetical protein
MGILVAQGTRNHGSVESVFEELTAVMLKGEQTICTYIHVLASNRAREPVQRNRGIENKER